MTLGKQNRYELMVYAMLWTIFFIAPVLSAYFSMSQFGFTSFPWQHVLFTWRQFFLLFIAFLLHNFFLAPLLIERQRRLLYFSLVAALLVLFFVVECSTKPTDPFLSEKEKGDAPREELLFDEPAPPHPHYEGEGPAHFDRPGHPDFGQSDAPFKRDGMDRKPPHDHEGVRPPLKLMDQHDAVALFFLVLMLGMNIGVKLYFRQRRDQEQLQQLQQQSLEQQLEYLRYQINPHFLMNTLNNIHALVDIDSERAKESIVGLSKIMRFMLYEGDKQTVPLSRELAFTQDYIQLMRMRITDRVRIKVEMPGRVPDCQIPPLVLITFVENAFKHGISYRQDSFINISISINESHLLQFSCSNSKFPRKEEHLGGVGLKNVRQRLDLLYGQNYSLMIADQSDTYTVTLQLPLTDH